MPATGKNLVKFWQGLESARTGVTPAIGEPLWTTDTKKLYVGDGVTAGGILISGGTGDLKADGTVPLTANWDVGSFSLRMPELIIDSATGIHREIGTDSLALSGDTSIALGGNIQLYGLSHSTKSGDLEFRDNTNVRLAWDKSLGKWDFPVKAQMPELIIDGTTGIHYENAVFFLSLSGGSTNDLGGNIKMYGETHASQANDIELRSTTTVELNYDDSVSTWDFKGNDIVFTEKADHAYTPVATKGIVWVRSDAPNVLVFTDDAGTDWDLNTVAGTGDLKADGSVPLTAAWDVGSFSLRMPELIIDSGAFGIHRDIATDELRISGGSTDEFGGNIRLFGETHGTMADEIHLNSGTNLVLKYDAFQDIWGFQNADVDSIFDLTINNAIRRAANNSYTRIYGGPSETTSAVLRLYGGTHATKANDVEFLATNAVELLYDDSVSTWDFQANDIVFTEKADHAYTPVATKGIVWVRSDAPNVLVFTDDAGTDWDLNSAAGSGDLKADGTVPLTANWDVGSFSLRMPELIIDATTGIHRDIATSTLNISGGTTNALGGNIILYAETHATKANDIDFRNNGTTHLSFDASANSWNFNNYWITNINKVLFSSSATGLHSAGATSALTFSGGATNLDGGRVEVYGETHGTFPGDVHINGEVNVGVYFDDSANTWDFWNNDLIFTEKAARNFTPVATKGAIWVKNDVPNTLQFTDDAGTDWLLNSVAGSGDLKADGTVPLTANWDVGAFSLRMPELIIDATTGIHREIATDTLNLSGGTTNALGANIVLYGETHATQDGEIEFRQDTTVRLHYTDFGTVWDFKNNHLREIQNITLRSNSTLQLNGSASVMHIVGSTSTGNGGRISLYGASHATQASDIELYGGAALQLRYDNSASTFNFQANDITTTGFLTTKGILEDSGVTSTKLAINESEIVMYSGLIRHNSSNSIFKYLSGNSVTLDTALWMYGRAHATQADDAEFRVGGVAELHYDSSVSTWDFQGNDIVFTEKADHAYTPVATKGILWVKNDVPNTLVFTDDAGTDWTLNQAGGAGDLKADGTVPLTANWDVGAFTITGTQFISDIAIGTAPFVVTSTTVVTNLNASTVEGNSAATLLARANHTGTQAETTITGLRGSKSVTIPDPVAADDATMFFTDVAITVGAVHSHITGTTNVVFNIGHAATRTGTQLDVFTADITLTSTAGQTNSTGFSDATIPANSWVWVDVVSVSGTPTMFHATVNYTED